MGVILKSKKEYLRASFRFQEEIIQKIEAEMKRQGFTAYALSQKTGISQATLSLLFSRELQTLTMPLVYSILLALNVKLDILNVDDDNHYAEHIFESQKEPYIPDKFLDYTLSEDDKCLLKTNGRAPFTVKVTKSSGTQHGVLFINKVSGLLSFCRTDVMASKYNLNKEQIFNLIDGFEVPYTNKGVSGYLFLDLDSGKIRFHK